MTTNRDESNRKIAEALGWRYIVCRSMTGEQCCGSEGTEHWHSAFTEDDHCPCGAEHGADTILPDFFLSEEANALVLEAIRQRFRYLTICFDANDGVIEIECSSSFHSSRIGFALSLPGADLKAFLCEAFLAMLEEKK